jgi:hypothetical protein
MDQGKEMFLSFIRCESVRLIDLVLFESLILDSMVRDAGGGAEDIPKALAACPASATKKQQHKYIAPLHTICWSC